MKETSNDNELRTHFNKLLMVVVRDPHLAVRHAVANGIIAQEGVEDGGEDRKQLGVLACCEVMHRSVWTIASILKNTRTS